MKYTVEVKEILQRQIEIEAENEGDAIEMVRKQYRNGDIILDADDFDYVEISLIEK